MDYIVTSSHGISLLIKRIINQSPSSCKDHGDQHHKFTIMMTTIQSKISLINASLNTKIKTKKNVPEYITGGHVHGIHNLVYVDPPVAPFPSSCLVNSGKSTFVSIPRDFKTSFGSTWSEG